MKEQRIADALGGVDPRFVLEAAPEERESRRHRRVRWGALAACLALAVALGATAALAAGVLDPLQSYFEGETEFYLEEILSSAGSVSNGEMELRVEGAAADESVCYVLVSMIARTDEVRQAWEKTDLSEQYGRFQVYALSHDGQKIEGFPWSSGTYTRQGLFGNLSNTHFSDADMTFLISCDLGRERMAETEKVCFGYGDLTAEVDVSAYRFPEAVLVSEDGEGELTDVRLSSIGLYFTAPYTEEPFQFTVRLIHADGTLASREEMEEIGLHLSGRNQGDGTAMPVTGNWGSAPALRLIDLEDYCGVEINGVRYLMGEQETAADPAL